MKSTVFRPLAFLTVALVGFAACNPLNKMAKNAGELNYTVSPNPLEMHGDSVTVQVAGKIPPKYFNKKATATLKPYFKADGQRVVEFDSINLIGESADGNGKKISFDGGSFSNSSTVAYQPGMEFGELWVTVIGKFKGKTKDIQDIKLADGTIITPMRVKSDDKPIIGKDNFQRITTDVHNAEIHYLINSPRVRPAELKDEDIVALMETIEMKAADSTYQFKKVDVQAYASPDGEISINENLANERANSAGNAVKRKLKKEDVEAAQEESFYNLVGKGEDWDGFKKAMQASDIKDKDLILRVLQMYPDVTKREQEIKNLAETYLEVKDQILPDLRRSQIAITVDKVGKSDEEIARLADSDPASLNVEELLYAATLTNDLNKKLAIYQSAAKIYADDWRGHNNAGYVLVLQNKLNDAAASFKMADSKSSGNPIIMNNMGVIARLQGDRQKAMEYYNKASGAGPEVAYNKGIVNILDGEYSTATGNFGSINDYNASLAKLLNGNPEGAVRTLDSSDDKNSAEGYYLKAIIAARTGKADMVSSNLKSAIEKDPSMRDRAKKDAEFLKYDFSSL